MYRAKYKNKKIRTPGHWFDSKLEQAVFELLKLREKAGEIKNLKHHGSRVFLSIAAIEMRPDFEWQEQNEAGAWIPAFGEAKGLETSDYRIKRKLWSVYGPGRLYVYKGNSRAVKLFEIVKP